VDIVSSVSKDKKPRIFYGWFILAAAFLIVAVGYSMRYSFSVFYAEILNEFGWSRAETAAAFSISLLVYGISSPIMGTLVDRFGPKRVLVSGASLLAVGLLAMSQMNNIWLFYFLFGIVMAVGINSLGFAVHNAYLPNWFVKKRGLAFGVLVAGASTANVLVALYQYLISSLGWRAAYGVLAFISFSIVVLLAVLLIRETPEKKGLLPDGSPDSLGRERSNVAGETRADLLIVNREWALTEWTLAKALKTYRLWFMFLMFLCLSVTFNLILGHQPIYCQDIGFSAMLAASIFGLVGITMAIGGLCGFVSDRIGREVTYTVGVIGTAVGICALMSATVSQPWLLYLFAIFFGIFFGITGPTGFSSLADLFSGKHFGAINGFCLLGFGVGGAIGPWLGGYIFDVMGSYTLAFVIVIVTHGLSCISLWLAAPRKVRLVAGKAPKAVTG